MVKLPPGQDCLQALQQRRACWAEDAAAGNLLEVVLFVLGAGLTAWHVVHIGQAVGPLVFLHHPWHY